MSGQTAWITGASSGIGEGLAKEWLARGGRCVLSGRNVAALEAVAAQAADRCLILPFESTDYEAIPALVSKAVAFSGGAGLHRGGKLVRLDVADWDAVLATNLSGPMYCARTVLPHMQSGAAIVNVGAVVGFRGFPGDSAYGASKAGLAGLTRVLAIELAPKNIRVNLVLPGLVITEMTSGLDEKARERLVADIPMRRTGTAEEIAEVIWWVAGSTYMTGAVIPTDGGLMAAL